MIAQIWAFISKLTAGVEAAAGDIEKVTAVLDEFNADVQGVTSALPKPAPVDPTLPPANG
jgi:hypothetical protein